MVCELALMLWRSLLIWKGRVRNKGRMWEWWEVALWSLFIAAGCGGSGRSGIKCSWPYLIVRGPGVISKVPVQTHGLFTSKQEHFGIRNGVISVQGLVVVLLVKAGIRECGFTGYQEICEAAETALRAPALPATEELIKDWHRACRSVFLHT